MSEELNNYVQAQLGAGTDQETIRKSLLQTGWDQATVDAVLSKHQNKTSQPTLENPTPTEPSIEPRLTPSKPSHQKGLLISIIIIVVLALIGGGVWAYFTFFSLKPEEVLTRMSEKMKDVNSYKYSSEINIDVTLPEEELRQASAVLPIKSGKFKIALAGVAQRTEDDENTEASFSLTNENTEIFSGEERILGTTMYYKVNNINVPILNLFLDTSAFTNQWIKVDVKELADQFGGDTELSNLVDIEKNQEKFKELEKKYLEKKLFTLKETFDDEKINDVMTYHYQVELNKPVIQELLTDFMKVTFDNENKLSDEAFKDIVDTEMKDMTETLNKINLPPIDLWIGKKDFYVYKMHARMTLKDFNIPTADLEDTGLKADDSIAFQVMLSEHNKPVKIEAPTDVKSIEDIMSEMSGGMFGGFMGDTMENDDAIFPDTMNDSELFPDEYNDSQSLNEEQPLDLWGNTNNINNSLGIDTSEVDPDQDGLYNNQEEEYGTDPYNPDTDGDGFLDGAEVQSGYNPNGPGKL